MHFFSQYFRVGVSFDVAYHVPAVRYVREYPLSVSFLKLLVEIVNRRAVLPVYYRVALEIGVAFLSPLRFLRRVSREE